MAFLFKWFVVDRLILAVLRHRRVRLHPAFQNAGPAYEAARPYLFPVLVRRFLLIVTLAAAFIGLLGVALLALLLQAIH